ncbi:uncharacterized protein [Dysidea avara]|uniref:uncharacterized protein n=1 Tax=Dysidea avara TaxID=196820 RepID=UPI00331CAEF3
MSKPTLTQLRKAGSTRLRNLRAQDKKNYWWHPTYRIGKGSFGEVYHGWEEAPGQGALEVAIKTVKKEFIDQDPKVKENLDREIAIMKALSSCQYAVRLHNVMDTKDHIILAMELCDCDLDQYVKEKSFDENKVKAFLYQMSEGMKVLQQYHIVHRDLKPSNILIKFSSPDKQSFAIKLADFGFARHFTTEGSKLVDMTSLAGTPVFMAPEALRCIFSKGKKYDEKVDLWSIGALLYKVIVGQCGFYANLQDILTILEKKGDHIAHVRSSGVYHPKYLTEFPSEVEPRLSPFFKKKMEELLVKLMKLEPSDRMTFIEFFDFVDDLVKSKLTVINVQDGSVCKVEFDKNISTEQLALEVQGSLGVPTTHQLLVHQLDDNLPIVNLSSMERHQFQLHIVSVRPDKEIPIYLLNMNTGTTVDRINDRVIRLLEEAKDDPMKGLTMIKEERFVETLIQSLHSHPSSLESTFHRQIGGVDQLWKFIASQRDHMMQCRVDVMTDYTSVEIKCDMMITSLQNQLDYFGQFLIDENKTLYTDYNITIESIKDELSAEKDKLLRTINSCNTGEVLTLSPTLISKQVTMILAGVKKLPKAPVAELQDRFGVLYDEYVVLGDLIAYHVSKAVQKLQTANNAIQNVYTLAAKLKTYCNDAQTRLNNIQQSETELYIALQNRLKSSAVTPATNAVSGQDYSELQQQLEELTVECDSLRTENEELKEKIPPAQDGESTLVAGRDHRLDPALNSFDFVSMPTDNQTKPQTPTKNGAVNSGVPTVQITPEQISVGDIVLFMPTSHAGQVFMVHTEPYFIFLDKSCLSEFGLSQEKSGNDVIAGEVISPPVKHTDPKALGYLVNPNVKTVHTIQCKKRPDIVIKGKPMSKRKH